MATAGHKTRLDVMWAVSISYQIVLSNKDSCMLMTSPSICGSAQTRFAQTTRVKTVAFVRRTRTDMLVNAQVATQEHIAKQVRLTTVGIYGLTTVCIYGVRTSVWYWFSPKFYRNVR